jgi:hypothetical protein
MQQHVARYSILPEADRMCRTSGIACIIELGDD